MQIVGLLFKCVLMNCVSPPGVNSLQFEMSESAVNGL